MFARGVAAPSSTNDTLSALVEIMKDPAASQARLAELQAAEEAAKVATAEAIARRTEANDAAAALNTRASALETQAARIAADQAVLDRDRTAIDKAKQDFAALSAETKRLQSARETDLLSRTAALVTQENATASLNRQAKADRDNAAALLASLKSIVADLEPLKAKIAALG